MTRTRSGAVAAVLLGLLLPVGAEAGTLVMSAPECESRCATAIWTAQDDGTGLRRLTDPAPPRSFDIVGDAHGGDGYGAWSNDGSRIAYTRFGVDPMEEEGLWVMNADGSGSRYVSRIFFARAWSPGDDLILFSERRHGDAAGLPDTPSQNPINISDSDVFTIRLDGSGVTRVVNSPIQDDNPRYSADGKRILVDRALYGSFPDPRTGTYSVALDGSDERRLTYGPSGRVQYSPDGGVGVYTWAGRLWVMNADGSQRRDRTPPGYWVHHIYSHSPVWGTDAGAAGAVLFFSAATLDTVHTSHPDMATFRLDVGDPDAQPILIPGINDVTDWKPARDDPAPHFVDTAAPAAFFLAGPSRAATASRARVLNRRTLGLVAADATGIRRIRLAVAKKLRRRGKVLCRFAKPTEPFTKTTELGKARRCDRPLFIRGSSEQELLMPLRLLKPGAYVMGFATVDVLRNRSGRVKLRPIRLR